MEKTSKVIIEELALEGPHGATWPRITELVGKRDPYCFVFDPTEEILESIKTSLLNDGTISKGRGEHFILADTSLRYQILGVGALPVISETPQYMRLLEMIARGRGSGAWSFNLCSAVYVDAKQLFHLTNPLVDFGLVHRKSNVLIPRKNRSALNSGASTATFFIHSKFASSPTDPEIAGIVETIDSAESVITLISTLLRESGGVMTAKTLRRTVVVVGGFLQKQYLRGRQKLIDFGRIEAVYIPSRSDDDVSDDEDDDELEDKKEVATGLVLAYKLIEDNAAMISRKVEDDIEVKEDPSPPITPEESEEEVIDSSETDTLVKIRMEARNLLKANFSFPRSVLMIIKTSGDVGVTTRDIARITGIAAKEVSKVLENLRTDSRIFCEWKNEGRKKFILYKWSSQPGSIKIEDEEIVTPTGGGTTPPLTPMSALSGGSGYVTAATVRRGTYVGEILSSRNGAMSLIDLGRAIEAKESIEGIGIPNTTIDRRTLRKICDIANFPVIEKTEFNSQLPSNTTKLMIVYDPTILTPEQAAQKVDRPIGFAPKPDISVMVKPEPKKIHKMDIDEIHRKSRLAAIAVFGNEQMAKIPVSFQVASIYGYITADIYKARMVHRYLVSSENLRKFRLSTLIQQFDLQMYLKVLGCGVLNTEIDAAFNDVRNGLLSMRIADIELNFPSLRLHLKNSVMGGNTETSHLSRILLPLVRLGLLAVDKEGYTVMESAVVQGVDHVGETVVVDVSTSDGVEEYWRILYKYCLNCKHGRSDERSSIYNTFPTLLKMSQWRSRIVLSLTQRRALENFLRRLISTRKSILVDGSNEDLVKVCVESKIEVAVALKALSGLLKVIGDEKAKSRIVFAHVLQARFCCHVCSKIFFQFNSVKAHYQQVHNAVDLPDDPEMYTRQEYMEAVERLRKGGIRGSKRNRRRRKSRTAEKEVGEDRDWKDTVALAKELIGEKGSGRGVFWQLVAQIRGIDKVPEMIIQRLTQESVTRTERVPEFVSDDRYQSVMNMLVFNTVVVDSDMGVIEKILLDNQMDSRVVMDRLGRMHANGKLARSGKSMTPTSILSSKTYVPSRLLKLKLFGKFGEIEKFISTRIQPENICTVIECEEAIEGVANALYINRELYFDIGAGHGGSEDDDGEEKEDEDVSVDARSHTGIRKHLELSGGDIGGEISRVEVADTKCEMNELQEVFFKNIKVHFDQSNIWRPTKVEVESGQESGFMVEFVEPTSLREVQHGCGNITEEDCLRGLRNLHACSPKMLRLLEVLQLVTVSKTGEIVRIDEMNPDVVWMTAAGGHQVSEFGRFLASLDLRWFSYYYCSWSDESGLRRIRNRITTTVSPRMRVASFTSVDGFINEQLIRDLMINVVHTISLAPGLTGEDLIERMGGVIPLNEIDLILASLVKLRLIYEEDKEWFIEARSNW